MCLCRRVCVSHIVHSSIVVCVLLVNSFESSSDSGSLMHLGVEFVLEDVQVVGGGDGDDVLGGVPGGVQDLLGEVQAVHADVVLPPLPSGGADPPRLQHGSGFAAFP